MGGRLLVRLAQQNARPDGVPVGEATHKATTLVRNTASPEDLGTGAGTLWLLSSLKSRCHCFQVLSCGIAVVSSWQDRLHKPRATWAVDSVERCSFVRLNAFQRNRVLGLCGRMHC